MGDRFAPGNELFIAYRDSRFVNFTDSNRLELTGQDISFTHRVKSIISAFTLPGALIFIWAIGSLLGFLFYEAEKCKSDDNAIAQSVFSILVWLSVSIFLVSLGGEETDRYNAGRASFIAQANNNLNIQETDTLGQFLPIGAGLQLRDTVPPVQHNSLTDIGIFFGMLGFVVGMLASLIAIAMGSKTLFVGALDTTIESEHKDGFKGVTDTKPFETGKTAITASVRTEVSKAKTRKHKAVTEELKAKAEINNAEIDIMKKEEELAIQKKELHLRKQRAEKEGKL